jgi:predicted lipid-binding transport protein (Tim44 family)
MRAWLASILFLSAATASAQVFVYPQKGQSAEQQQKDQSECQQWATQQSGVNPNAPAAGPDRGKRVGGALGGAARGAAGGALIGAIAGDAGKGAAIGATVGGIGGRRGAIDRERAGQAAESDAYTRAFAACMEGRGYTVK